MFIFFKRQLIILFLMISSHYKKDSPSRIWPISRNRSVEISLKVLKSPILDQDFYVQITRYLLFL
jgi:hypothetical protein